MVTRAGHLVLVGIVLVVAACSAPHTKSAGFFGLKREPLPGYVWKYPDTYSTAVEWRRGTREAGYPHAQATSIEGQWMADPGYQFAQAGDPTSAAWSPGSRHADFPHARAALAEGQWGADPGYQFGRPDDFTSATWSPGSRYSGYPHARADIVQDRWLEDPGYLFLRTGDLSSARWSPGTRHPNYPNIYAATNEGSWQADTGYQWASADSRDLRVVPAYQPASAPYSPAPSPGNDVGRRIVHAVARSCAEPGEDDGFLMLLGRVACAFTAIGTSSPGD